MKTKTIPISKRMKSLRGQSLDDRQRNIISEFMTKEDSPEDADAFAKGFENSKELVRAESELDNLTDKKARSAWEKNIRRLKNEITPSSRQAAIDSHRFITEETLKYIRNNGVPKNIRHFIKELKDKNVLNRTYKAGGTIVISERTVRDILREKFGIKGKPGRKPG